MVAFIFSFICLIIGGVVGTICVANRDNYDGAKIGAGIAYGIGAILFVTLMLVACLTSVETGPTGVPVKFGEVQDYTLDSGLHSKAPWIKIVEMDNRVQKATVDMEAFSEDIQEVKCTYTLNYQISKENATEIYRTIGKDYYNNVITPNISKAVKTAMAGYTAEELVNDRSGLATNIEDLLRESLSVYHINVVGTSVEDLDFTDSFTNAVEAKQVAVQNKLKAVTEQEQKTIEEQQSAERTKIKATADAEVAKIQAEADMEVAKIGADSAEYQGKKDASIKMQALASINGWTVVPDSESGINKLYKTDGTEVTAEELKAGTQRLIEYYYTQTWNGILPETYVGDGGVSSIILKD